MVIVPPRGVIARGGNPHYRPMAASVRKTLGTATRLAVLHVLLSVLAVCFGVIVYLYGPGSAVVAILCGVVVVSSTVAIAAEILHTRQKKAASRAISDSMAASERLAGLGSVAAAVAHEIRNPLSALDIHAQLLDEDLPSITAETRKHIDIIRAETHRLNLIVENFIRFARHKPLDSRPAQMVDHLANVLRLIESEANDRNVVIDHTQLRRDLPEVVADPNQLEQAFLNIVINALQSMPNGGRLTLSSRVRAEYVECTISNTGEEIPSEIRDKIFGLYFTTKENGSGLGLPIAQKILSEHNGYITVTSDPSQTSFSLGLPRAAEA